MRSYCVGLCIVLAVSLLGGVLLLSGCGQKVAAPLPFEVKTSTATPVITKVTLHGTVRDQAGVPVAGAWVTLGSKRIQTGADGTYTFTNLLPGTYYVSVSSAGYVAGGAPVLVSTADVLDANIYLKAFASIDNVEEVRGTETVEVSEEGVVETKTTVVSLVPPAGQTSEDVLDQGGSAAGLVVDAGVTIKDAAGNVVTEAPALSVTYLEQSQCPLPSSGAFGMKPEDVYTKTGTKETTTQEVVVEGETVTLTVETPNEMLTKGTTVQASNVPFAGFVLEANGEQGGTFSEPQTLTINPEQLSVPVDLLGSGLPVGAQIPFVDSDGEVIYATLQEDGSIDLEVTKIDTYLMQTDFNLDVMDTEVTASLAGTAKPVAPQATITGFTEFLFAQEIDETTKAQIISLILTYMNLAEYIEQQVALAGNQQIVQVRTECKIIVEVVLGEYTLKTYTVTIISVNGVIQEIKIVVVVHESGGSL